MAASTLNDVTEKLKNMGKEKAEAYILKQKDAISKLAPDKRALLTSAYSQAFLGAKSEPESHRWEEQYSYIYWDSDDSHHFNSHAYSYIDPTPTTTTTPTPTVVATPPPVGFTHNIGGQTFTFSPTQTLASGVAFNKAGTTEQEKFGITTAQQKAITGYIKQLDAAGVAQADRTKLAADYIALLQKNNLNDKTYGTHNGSTREGVTTDPMQAKGTIGSMVDLDKNGVPDSQEGFGVGEPPKDSSMTTDITGDGTKVTIDDTYWNNLEKDFIKKDQELTNRAIELERLAAESTAKVANDKAKAVIAAADERIQQINGMLDEQIAQNDKVYTNAVGDVYRQLGGNVKQFQRLIGSDGKAIDDATMLAITGDLGVISMQTIIDLKNKLVQTYLDRKAQAQKDIYALVEAKTISSSEASEAVNAINILSEKNVLAMTKSFYDKMFSTADAIDARNVNQKVESRAAVSTYLTALGLTPEQQTQVINNYVAKGFTAEDAVDQLAEDIRDGKTAIPAWMLKNTEEANAAAKAAFDQKMALARDPIITKGNIDLQLQNDKQAFEAEQNALDRQLRSRIAASSAAKIKTGKPLTLNQKTNQLGAAQVLGGVPIQINGWTEDLDIEVKTALSRIMQTDASGKSLGTPSDQQLIKELYALPQGTPDIDPTKARDAFTKAATPTTEQVTP